MKRANKKHTTVQAKKSVYAQAHKLLRDNLSVEEEKTLVELAQNADKATCILGSNKKISKDKEKKLLDDIEIGKEARERLYEAYTRLILSIINKLGLESIPDDLVTAAYVGLGEAIQNVNESEARLATYAVFYIKSAIFTQLNINKYQMRIPSRIVSQFRTIMRISMEYRAKHNCPIPNSELYKKLAEKKIPRCRFKQFKQLPGQKKLFDHVNSGVDDDEELELIDTMPNDDQTPEEVHICSEIKAEQLEIIDKIGDIKSGILNDTEIAVLGHSFGLFGFTELCNKDLAAKLGIKETTLCNKRTRALDKIMRKFKEGEIDTYVAV